MEILTYAKQLQLNTEFTYKTGLQQGHSDNNEVILGFTKPDKPTINPKEGDGFRRPSSYSCPAISRVGQSGGRRYDRAFLTYQLGGSGVDSGGTEISISGTGYTGVGNTFNPPTPNVNALRSKLLNNVRSEVLDVAMVLAEMQGTTDTIVTGLSRLARSMQAVKKGNPRHYSYLLSGRTKDNRRPTDKFLRESSGVFLEWKYGIMPTVYDIAGACKAMDMNENGSFWDNPPLLVGRATEITTSSINTKIRVGEAAGASSASIPVSFPTRVEYKARIDYSIRGEGLRGLNRYGIGLSSIPTVLFDKTPFSFVLNMALPMSELIKAWTALAGVDVRGYCETLHKSVSAPRGSASVSLRGIPCTVNFLEQPDWISWERRAFSTVPMPMPYLRNPIKTGNLATVLALFTQLRKP